MVAENPNDSSERRVTRELGGVMRIFSHTESSMKRTHPGR
jgi:hypothetical protein